VGEGQAGHDAASKEELNVRRVKRASIRSEMTRRDFFIVDYSDDSMDLSDEDEE
jgi:hypothetical protein